MEQNRIKEIPYGVSDFDIVRRDNLYYVDKTMYGSPAKTCGLSIDSRKSKQEEFSVNDTSKLRPELFDFSIERFCCSIG